MRHTKTVGVISDDEVTGLTLIAEPVGVICGITPTTNPTSTAIFKSLIALKTRNPIVFAFHPSAQKSSATQLKSFVMQRLQLEHLKTVFNGLNTHLSKRQML